MIDLLFMIFCFKTQRKSKRYCSAIENKRKPRFLGLKDVNDGGKRRSYKSFDYTFLKYN